MKNRAGRILMGARFERAGTVQHREQWRVVMVDKARFETEFGKNTRPAAESSPFSPSSPPPPNPHRHKNGAATENQGDTPRPTRQAPGEDGDHGEDGENGEDISPGPVILPEIISAKPRSEKGESGDVWGQRVGSSAKSVGCVGLSFEKSEVKRTGYVGSVGCVGETPQIFSYSAREEEKNTSPLAQTLLATLNGTPMWREDLERALSLAHGKAGPALIKATVDRLLLSGAIAPINGKLVNAMEGRP